MVSILKTNELIHRVLMKMQLPVTISFWCLVWLDSAHTWEDTSTAHKLPARVFAHSAAVSWEIHIIMVFCQFWLRVGSLCVTDREHSLKQEGVTEMYSFSMLLSCNTYLTTNTQSVVSLDHFKLMPWVGSIVGIKWAMECSCCCGWSLEFIIHSSVQKLTVLLYICRIMLPCLCQNLHTPLFFYHWTWFCIVHIPK